MAVYEPNNHEFGKLMRSKMIGDVVEDAAHRGAAFLAVIAPEDEGHYKSSISVERGYSLTGDRAAAFIVVDDDSAAPMEFGNEHVQNPPKPLEKVREFIEKGGLA